MNDAAVMESPQMHELPVVIVPVKTVLTGNCEIGWKVAVVPA